MPDPEKCKMHAEAVRVCHHPHVLNDLADRPLLVVDGDNLAHRAYHSTPKTVLGADGSPINAIVGFTSMLMNIWQAERPRGIFVAWDTLDTPTYRHKLWPPYQGGREFEHSIVQQLGMLPTICESLGLAWGQAPGYEADDLMAAAALEEVRNGGTALLLTTDRDAYQLVNERITVLAPTKGVRDLIRIGPAQVVERMGVLPEQVPDFKALSGDSSDKIPGAKGIGPKNAASLILKYGTLENVLANWPNAAEADQVRRFKEVVLMHPEVPVTLPHTGPPNWTQGAEALRILGANTLADRVAALANSF